MYVYFLSVERKVRVLMTFIAIGGTSLLLGVEHTLYVTILFFIVFLFPGVMKFY